MEVKHFLIQPEPYKLKEYCHARTVCVYAKTLDKVIKYVKFQLKKYIEKTALTRKSSGK